MHDLSTINEIISTKKLPALPPVDGDNNEVPTNPPATPTTSVITRSKARQAAAAAAEDRRHTPQHRYPTRGSLHMSPRMSPNLSLVDEVHQHNQDTQSGRVSDSADLAFTIFDAVTMIDCFGVDFDEVIRDCTFIRGYRPI